MRERYLWLAADFDNYRKRMARDAQRCGAEQKEALVRDMLPVLDNLERGLACSDMGESDRFRTGVHATLQQATHVLGLHGFIPQDDLGQEFDPRFHEAVAVRAAPGHPQGTILEVCQRGWRRESVPFRPAKVIVNVTEDRNKNGGSNHAEEQTRRKADAAQTQAYPQGETTGQEGKETPERGRFRHGPIENGFTDRDTATEAKP